MTQPWHCEAYGPEGVAVGAVCFVSGELHERKCADAGVCHTVMTAERQRVFQRMNELAAGGDEVSAYLTREFTSPEQLLGGSEDPPPMSH